MGGGGGVEREKKDGILGRDGGTFPENRLKTSQHPVNCLTSRTERNKILVRLAERLNTFLR